MRKRTYVRAMRAIIALVVVAFAIMIGRAMPVYREQVVTKVERQLVVRTVREGDKYSRYGRAETYDAVCRGHPGLIKAATVVERKKNSRTYFLLQPVNENFVVPCSMAGNWPEFEVGQVISLTKGQAE